MNGEESKKTGPAIPSDPDDLISGISRLSIWKTSLGSLVAHAVLIGVTSIGFIALCTQHKTLHPREAQKLLAEEQRQAKREDAREKARQAALARQAAASQPAAKAAGAGAGEKSPIERKLEAKSFEKPKPSTLGLDGLQE